MQKKVAVVQSNYIPWKGYFDLIRSVDAFVLYDDVQYTRRDWRNRNKIKTAQGEHWLSVPVKNRGRYEQLINEVEVSEADWAAKHWKTIEMNYRRAACFNQMELPVRTLYEQASEVARLSSINQLFITGLCALLGIDTPLYRSEELGRSSEGKNQRLIHLCQALGATEYLSGPAASSYLDEAAFAAGGLEVSYMSYAGYPEYPQLFGGFEHAVSVLDLLFNTGSEASNFLERHP
ncbi:WbqC family protein [Pseudomonas sp. B21-023]|uniref:WbqC family protein n=1 Tax=unclassified Pseudomonas TaxID=196821 RepID=UPI001118034C|nr:MULTISPECIES: WbqC family protein [unclassified Pseudomonas]UVL20750.1 WbqC family protein [Pseudomonas sp. B21-044]UVM18152.1 WbqC family protein [Pseudomonas sp. B21-023]